MEYSCFIGTKSLEPSEEKSKKVGPKYLIIGIDYGWAVEDNRRKKVVIGQ